MKTTIRTPDGKVYTGEVVESLRVEGQEYWFIDHHGLVTKNKDLFVNADNHRYNTLNYFKTVEEAKAKRTYELAVGEVTRRIQELGEGESSILYCKINKLFTWATTNYNYATILPLMSEETVKTIIKEHKDTLLPVIFKIN